jgi:Ca-activated chloride channel family protein
MTRQRVFGAVVIGAVLSAAVRGQQTPVFRAGTDAVVVSVSVRSKNRPVAGLTPADFQLYDNGVPQTISSTSAETLPVDVTLVLDTSGSLQGEALARLKSDIQKIADLLQIHDRVRLITFATQVGDAFGFQPAGALVSLDHLTAGGKTSFYNALAAALMAMPGADRPQLVFAFSDGLDNASFLDARLVADVAAYSTASLYVGLVPSSSTSHRVIYPTGMGPSQTPRMVPNRKLLEEAVVRTGGALFEQEADGSLSGIFRKVLEDFRATYILRYTPQGVRREGWHDILVKTVRRPNLDVRARKGYQGG